MDLLIVDDSEIIKTRLLEVLKNTENITSITTAGSIEEARATTEKTQRKAHVIILDIQLPDGDGLEFLKWIKEVYPKTIVIMYSGFSEVFFRSMAKRMGADYFLDKSTEFEQIPIILSQINIAQ